MYIPIFLLTDQQLTEKHTEKVNKLVIKMHIGTITFNVHGVCSDEIILHSYLLCFASDLILSNRLFSMIMMMTMIIN